MRRFGLLLATILLAAALPVLAVPESAPDGLAVNRRLVDQYRADPEHYARLVRDLRAFQALPLDRQEKIRQFDRALHEQGAETQKHLWEVLERYVAWVDRLPDADQKRLDDAHDPTEKLAIVRELRQQQWIDRLPAAERKELAAMTPPLRASRVAVLREEDGKQQQAWADWANSLKKHTNFNSRSYKPVRLAEFPESVQQFVDKRLKPMLREEENGQLAAAQGKWPSYAQTILELSEKHPVLPPLPTGKIERFNQLPKEVKDFLLKKKKVRGILNKNSGKWPQLALAAADLMKHDKHAPPLGASRPAEFPSEVQTFLQDKEVQGALTVEDQTKLRDAEGRWPEYPLLLLKLARKHDLIVPGMSLPGPVGLWNHARNALPNVPTVTLEEFYSTEFNDADRARFNRAADDPDEQLEILKEAYFKKHPDRLEKFRRLDQRGANGKKP